jgi:hypothetical protein
VSNFPHWRWHAAGGVGFAALVFGTALAASRRRPTPALNIWLGVAGNAVVSGLLAGWTLQTIPVESLTTGDWIRSLGWATVALGAPVAGAAAAASGVNVPRLRDLLGRRSALPRDPLVLVLGLLLVVLVVLALQAAFGLVFNPRYRDFPFTALTSASIPFLMLTASRSRPWLMRPSAESVAAASLALCALYIVFNETPANWQALWFCAGLLALAVSLVSARDAPNSG